MERKLINYLPMFVQEYEQIQQIMDTEQKSVEEAWETADAVMCEQFVEEAQEHAIQRWEKMLGITVMSTESLELRRFEVSMRLKESGIFTMPVLKQMLENICGKNGYKVIVENESYLLLVKLSMEQQKKHQIVETFLRRMLPANIQIQISQFNTHLGLSKYTHEYLAQRSYQGVREDNL